MGGQSGTSQSQTPVNPTATIAPQVAPLVQQSAQQLQDVQPQIPITDFTGAQPQSIPGLTADQQGLINSLVQAPYGNQISAPEMAALFQVDALTGGPVGSSPATQAGMQAWEQIVRPQVMQEQALQGTTGGGAADEAIANSASAAAVPLIQQEITNRVGTLPTLTGIGQKSTDTEAQQLQAGLQAAQQPYDIESAQAQAEFADFLRRQGLAEEIDLGPIMSVMPSMIMPTVANRATQAGSGGLFGS
jgi:hypothetical protein